MNHCERCGEPAVDLCEDCGECGECCHCSDGPSERQIQDAMNAPSAAERQADAMRAYLDLK